MRKFRAFTLAEICIAMIIIMIISSFCMSYIKPNTQKLKLFTYASIMNMQKGNAAVMGKYSSLIPTSTNSASCDAKKYSVGCNSCSGNDCTSCIDGFELADYSASGTVRKVCRNKDTGIFSFYAIQAGYDGYCLRLADNFSLKEPANCKTTSAGDATVNLRFSNGSTFQGIATPWITPYTNAPDKYKNIVFDLDGEKGANKIWVDRVPLRIYAGGYLNGMVLPVDCTSSGDNYFFNGDTQITLNTNDKNPYCKQGWSANGARAEKNFLIDNEVVSYDIYRSESEKDDALSKVIVSSASIMYANCASYGDEGAFHRKTCVSFSTDDTEVANKKGYRINPRCVTKTMCDKCWRNTSENICPRTDAGQDVTGYEACLAIRNKYNPEDINCYILPHKPSVGAGFILNGTLDSLDM